MSLQLALSTALTGLNVNQQALQALSQNIANVNTKGYSRKLINQSTQVIAGVGVGVRIDDLTRKVDLYLARSALVQQSTVGRSGINSDYADRTQLMLGNPGAATGLNSYVTRLFGQFQSLTQTPSDVTIKTSVVNDANNLAREINKLAQGLQDLRYQADRDISASIATINSDLQQVFQLNSIITRDRLLGRPTAENEDKRDILLTDLSQYMEIQTFETGDGNINVSVGGISLVDQSLYALSYSAVSSVDAMIDDGTFNAVKVYRVDENGNQVGNPSVLISSGTSDTVISAITNGKIKGYLDQRDSKLPDMLAQLDQFAAKLRDEINAIHNKGSGFPGATSYTGTREISAGDYSQWTGSVRIAVLDSNGQPVSSGYSSLPGGLPPLTIDLSTLNGGNGQGYPSVQSIIDEINQYYGVQENRVSIGPLTNMRLASNSARLPGSPAAFNFDLDLENFSAGGADVFVTGIQVLDDTSADIISITTNVPDIDIAASNSFVTTNGSNVITVTTANAHGLSNGDQIFLPDITAEIAPALDVNGIPLSELNDQLFTVSNVTNSTFEITVTSNATATGGVNATGAAVRPPYATVDPGETFRTTDDALQVSLAGNSTSATYTINMSVIVVAEDGTTSTAQISYEVTNDERNILNQRYAAAAVSGQATLITPTDTDQILRARLVDGDGDQLTISNGAYELGESGFLQLEALRDGYYISIDSLDSVELGNTDASPDRPATNRGFSHYFDLNNFFVENTDSDTSDDTDTNSAVDFAVVERLLDDPSQLTTGRLKLVPTAPGDPEYFTYERTVGDQSLASELAELGLTNISFDEVGGMSASSVSLSGYAGQIISVASLNANTDKNTATNDETVMQAMDARKYAISGVNLDEELANTIIYQNAYTASARIITVTNNLFDELLNTFQG